MPIARTILLTPPSPRTPLHLSSTMPARILRSPAVRRATSAGIPVFLIDREIAVSGIARAQIIANNDQRAGLVAESLPGGR